ncbi:hypothetical protein CPB83DRAFT_888076 [Crepidotus variabilis]|uniref:Uncharacterized protein n=1 Tax=Crepidotus variabilis TaxID=179855 RepID=A0A9P6JWP4_9AGAR|nr:hypothetical protein CPB83DRAFT_888076 [Crepidotus variabilis]
MSDSESPSEKSSPKSIHDSSVHDQSSNVQQEMWWDDPPEAQELQRLEGKIFVKGEFRILEKHLDNYLALKKGRSDFIQKKIVPKIAAFWGSKYSEDELKNASQLQEWIKRQKSVANYFANRAVKRNKVRVRGLSLKVPLKKVISDLHAARILKTQTEMTSTKSIGRYSQAVKQVRDGLTDKELEEAKATQKQWEDNGIPMEVQAKMASTQGRRYCTLFDDWRFKRLGMRCFTLEAHRSKKHDLVFCMHDTTGKFRTRNGSRVQPFEDFDPQAVKAINTSFRKYARYLEKVEKGEIVGEAVPDGVSADSIRLDEIGLPILPERKHTNGSEYKVKEMQSLIRFYLNKHWAAAKGSAVESMKVPYKHIMSRVEEFIDEDYLPGAFQLKETSRYTVDDGEKEVALYPVRKGMNEEEIFEPTGVEVVDPDGDQEEQTVGVEVNEVEEWHRKLEEHEQRRVSKLKKAGKSKGSKKKKKQRSHKTSGMSESTDGEEDQPTVRKRKGQGGGEKSKADEETDKEQSEPRGKKAVRAGGKRKAVQEHFEEAFERAMFADGAAVINGSETDGVVLKFGPPRGVIKGKAKEKGGRRDGATSTDGGREGSDQAPAAYSSQPTTVLQTPEPAAKARKKPSARPVGQEKLNRMQQKGSEATTQARRALNEITITSTQTPTVHDSSVKKKSISESMLMRRNMPLNIPPKSPGKSNQPMQQVVQLPTPERSNRTTPTAQTPTASTSQNLLTESKASQRGLHGPKTFLLTPIQESVEAETTGDLEIAPAAATKRARKPAPPKDIHITRTEERVRAYTQQKEGKKQKKND